VPGTIYHTNLEEVEHSDMANNSVNFNHIRLVAIDQFVF